MTAHATDRTSDTRQVLLDAARHVLRERGYSGLSTRAVAEQARMPLSQIHYHFGSKQALLLGVLEDQNRALLDRQRTMYAGDAPLWQRWNTACDYLEEDMASGYVRVLHELIAAGWSSPDIATALRPQLDGWLRLLTQVAAEAERRFGGLGPFSARDVSFLVGAAFLGAEELLLLVGTREERTGADRAGILSALRAVGRLIQGYEDQGHEARRHEEVT